MEKIRPRGLPAIPYISDFHELNLRTYVTAEGKPGVYFLHISAQKELSVWLAKLLSGLPYERSTISRLQQDDYQTYSLLHSIKPFKLNAEFRVADPIEVKSPLDFWLTERYCLYVEHGNSLFRYDVHHAPWQLKNIHLLHLTMDGLPGNIVLDRMPDLAHYSRGVKVLAWQKSSVIRQPR